MAYEIPAFLTDPHRIALLVAIAGAAAAIAATSRPGSAPIRSPDGSRRLASSASASALGSGRN